MKYDPRTDYVVHLIVAGELKVAETMPGGTVAVRACELADQYGECDAVLYDAETGTHWVQSMHVMVPGRPDDGETP